eukprot:TRINITY_DN12406_c0_g1_i2.p1 TRINITY_DN12406_c0_g1~~TRINITY_DN12406_c0_g1_i2.p1  ORF type:complete len:1132 (-),score=130.16 TRINITY_DN12406_c0_g1_i2:309-3650(-)
MPERVEPKLLLHCAQALDSIAPVAVVDDLLRRKSFELVEELAFALSQKLAQGTNSNMIANGAAAESDLAVLCKIAELRVLIAQRVCADDVRAEVQRRNATCDQEVRCNVGSLHLAPFRCTAFAASMRVLWAVNPLEHHAFPGTPERKPQQLKHLTHYHSVYMQEVLGAFVDLEHLPPELVVQHVTVVLGHTEAVYGNVAKLQSKSVLHEDLQAFWRVMDASSLGDVAQDCLADLGQRGLPCVPVEHRDAADCPRDMVVLAPVMLSFFKTPAVQNDDDEVWPLAGHLHVVSSHEIAATNQSVFRLLGVRDQPEASDYAFVTRQMAERAAELEHEFKYFHDVVDACVNGWVKNVKMRNTTGEEVRVAGLHLFDRQGRLADASELVWVDEYLWERRTTAIQLRFTFLRFQWRETLIRSGLRKLSDIVYEKFICDDVDDIEPNPFRDSVAMLVSSAEFVRGLFGIVAAEIEDSKMSEKEIVPPEYGQVDRAVNTIVFRSRPGNLQSALFWRNTGEQVPESEERQCVFGVHSVIFIANLSLEDWNRNERLRRLAEALIGALATTVSALAYLLKPEPVKSMLACAFSSGPSGIADALQAHCIQPLTGGAIDSDRIILKCGDRFPDALFDYLSQSLEETFQAGEYVATRVHDVLLIAKVESWPHRQAPVGEGLTRCYYLRISEDESAIEVRRHFELYKIHWGLATNMRRGGSEVTVAAGPGLARDATSENVPEQGDAEATGKVRRTLREMGRMCDLDYRVALRRLYLTWHPDRAGNTQLANSLFRMIRRHADWYQRRLKGEIDETDDWLDDDDARESAGTEEADAEEKGTVAAGTRASGQESWIDEFERERQEERGGARQHVHIQPIHGFQLSCTTSWTPPRIVDFVKAELWLQQARLEHAAAQRLMEPSPAGWRVLPASAVWHCSQVVEMAVKSTMLRTCGITVEELKGKQCHDLVAFGRRLQAAPAVSQEQRHAKELPASLDDLEWLSRAYIGARYPNNYTVPGFDYHDEDAQRALELAKHFLRWASHVEDLAGPLVSPTDPPGGVGGRAAFAVSVLAPAPPPGLQQQTLPPSVQLALASTVAHLEDAATRLTQLPPAFHPPARLPFFSGRPLALGPD